MSPERALADQFSRYLGVDINPQALRMFIISRWNRITPLAHQIHDKAKEEA